MFEGSSKREVLQGLRDGAGELTAAQREKVVRQVGRATTKESITVVRQSNGTILIMRTRPGADGSQTIITRVYGNGAEATVQTANNASGQLVHYDPKKTYWWDTVVQWFSGGTKK